MQHICGHLWYGYSVTVKTGHAGDSKTWPLGITGSVAALLTATLYQGMHDWNHKLWNIGSTEIYIYTPYAGAAGMLLHINGKFTMGKFK